MDIDTPWTTPEERWRQLVLWRNHWAQKAPGYVVSSLGRIGRLGVKPGRGRRKTGDYLLKPLWSGGAAQVSIAGRRWTIARLVAYAFLEHPDPECYWEVGFRDGDHANFRPENLEWRRRYQSGGNWSRTRA